MDGKRFDDLTKRLFATRLTRLGTLKGLASGALAAVTGTVLSEDELEAKRDKRHAGHQHKQKHDGKHQNHGNQKHKGGAGPEFHNPKKKKKTICHCGGSDPTTCKTLKLRKKAAKKHLRHICDYIGACTTGRSGCQRRPTGCTADAQCASVPCQKCDLTSGTCVSACNPALCQECTNNQCVDKCEEPTICDGKAPASGAPRIPMRRGQLREMHRPAVR